MQWTRLHLLVEGQTELQFAKDVLGPHLKRRTLVFHPRMIVTNRQRDTRGGLSRFSAFARDLRLLLREDRGPDARFTTMLDLYALPRDFPAWADARGTPRARATALEAALDREFDDPRFFAHLQLHEFEALLFCDLTQLELRLDTKSRPGVADLRRDTRGLDPEDIDEGESTAPSKRIIRHVPIYEKTKVNVGAAAAAAIGLPALRARCPHFDSWVARLEALGAALDP